MRKGKSAPRTPALTPQKSALFPGKLVNSWHTPTTKHTICAPRRKIMKEKPERPCQLGENVSFFLPIVGFYSWSKLIQIATEKRSPGENKSVIKYANSGCPNIRAGRRRLTFLKHKILFLLSFMQPSPKLMKSQTMQWPWMLLLSTSHSDLSCRSSGQQPPQHTKIFSQLILQSKQSESLYFLQLRVPSKNHRIPMQKL